jgi:hypothetical protein
MSFFATRGPADVRRALNRRAGAAGPSLAEDLEVNR